MGKKQRMSAKLLIADHQEVMRAGLKALLGRSAVEIVGEVENERDLLKALKKKKPDVVILDVRFAGEDGFAVLGRLRKKAPEVPLLMWATDENPTYIARSMALGAAGFLARDWGRSPLLSAIRKAASGKPAWGDEEIRTFTGCPELPPGVSVSLTPREREVVRQLGYGLSNKEIAMALHISYETVKEHIQHILRKLEATDRTEAAVWAVKNGLV